MQQVRAHGHVQIHKVALFHFHAEPVRGECGDGANRASDLSVRGTKRDFFEHGTSAYGGYCDNPLPAVADRADYNHGVGNNMLKADLRVEWFSDPEMIIHALLPNRVDSPNASQLDVAAVEFALDTGNSSNARPENGRARDNHISAGLER